MAETLELSVHLACDQETGRWYIAESDIPGLWLEADTAPALMARVAEAAPEIIQLSEAEIIAAFGRKSKQPKSLSGSGRARPTIRPVFDSPLELAYA